MHLIAIKFKPVLFVCIKRMPLWGHSHTVLHHMHVIAHTVCAGTYVLVHIVDCGMVCSQEMVLHYVHTRNAISVLSPHHKQQCASHPNTPPHFNTIQCSVQPLCGVQHLHNPPPFHTHVVSTLAHHILPIRTHIMYSTHTLPHTVPSHTHLLTSTHPPHTRTILHIHTTSPHTHTHTHTRTHSSSSPSPLGWC